MEFASYGDCEVQLQLNKGPLKEAIVTNILLHCLLGLDYLHQRNLMHRDVKLANIVVTQDERFKTGRAMLCDFGLVKEL